MIKKPELIGICAVFMIIVLSFSIMTFFSKQNIDKKYCFYDLESDSYTSEKAKPMKIVWYLLKDCERAKGIPDYNLIQKCNGDYCQ